MDGFNWVFLIPVVAIVGGVLTSIASIMAKGRVRELEIRERIAMIERGLVPPPEADPAGFDRAMNRFDRFEQRRAHLPWRHRRAGVMLIGVGFGVMLLIGLTGDENPRTAIGVGGFLVVMGIAFFINSLLEPPRGEWASRPSNPTPPPPAQPPAAQSPRPD